MNSYRSGKIGSMVSRGIVKWTVAQPVVSSFSFFISFLFYRAAHQTYAERSQSGRHRAEFSWTVSKVTLLLVRGPRYAQELASTC